MTKYLFLTTILAITHAGGTKTQTQNKTNATQVKTEVSTIPAQKSKNISSNDSSREIPPTQSNTSSLGLSSSISSRKSSQEIIRELQEQNTNLLMKLDPLRDKLAKITVELKEKTIQLETRQKYSNLPDSIHLQTIDELTYDLLSKERQVKILKEKIVPHYQVLLKENEALKAQLA